MNFKKLLRFFLGIPLTIISFLFIVKVFFDGRDQIISSLFSIKLELFFLGILFYTLFFAVKSFIWLKILSIRGHTPEPAATIYNYSISEIKRYIPGSIFAFIGRVDTHKAVPRSETLKGIGIEAFLLVLSAVTVSLPALYFLLSKYLPISQVIFNLSLVLVLSIASSIIFFNKKLSSVLKNYFDTYLLFVLAWGLYAIGSLFIFLSLTFVNPSGFITVASIFTACWLGGYLLFVTPMGLGARELIATYSLSFFISPALASAIAVMTRLSMITGELLYLAVARLAKDLKGSKLLRINPYLCIVIAISLLYFIFFSYYTVLRHDVFLSGRFDLGNMDQTVWNTSQGRFFTLTNPDGTNIMSRLGVHSDIFLALLAPLYFIWNDPGVLLILQTLSLAFAGIFVYLISKKITKREVLSVIFSFSFFANFWIHEQNIFDFHAVSIATFFLLAAFYFLIKKRAVLFVIFLALAATTKENIFLILSVFGIFFLTRKVWKLGTILTVAPILIFYFLVAFAIPQVRGKEHFALDAYKYLGDSPLSVVKNSLHNPEILFHQLFNLSTLEYLNNHLFSTGYLALLSPFYLLFTLPDALIYLFSSNTEYRSYQYHFGAVIVPFVYIAAIYSSKKLIEKFKKVNVARVLSYYLIAFTIYSLYFFSPIPGMKNGDITPLEVTNSQVISRYLSVIPKDADVAASNTIGAHLSHRKYIYVVPYGINEATYVVFYNENNEMKEKLNNNYYTLLIGDDKNNFYLYKKKMPLSCSSCMP